MMMRCAKPMMMECAKPMIMKHSEKMKRMAMRQTNSTVNGCEKEKHECERKMSQESVDQCSTNLRKKEVETTKEQKYEEIIKCQKANGEFVGVDKIIKEIKEVEVDDVESSVIQTFFVIEVLQEKFSENKVEWKLVVKKAENWLSSKPRLKEDIKTKIHSIVKSLQF
ncbi:hypothetical protein KM1_153170 [Entamoeba histolytica HM-3:IMSS]|nr:hypothetical protein KM1_153170 [Entamoeba histolytica HM-3:IMSS]